VILFNFNADSEADSPLSGLLGSMLSSILLDPSFDGSKLVPGVLFVDELYSQNIERDCNFTDGRPLYKLLLKLTQPDNDGLDRSKDSRGPRRLLLDYKRRYGECWLGSDNRMLKTWSRNLRKCSFRSKRLVGDVWPGDRRKRNDKSWLIPSLSIISLRYKLCSVVDFEGR
jgi:hypothetical protein